MGLKKLLSVLFVVMSTGISNPAFATSILLLNGVEATGTSSAVYLAKTPITVDLYWTNTGGSVTALTLDVEGSSDNSNYHQLVTYTLNASELTNKKAAFHIVDKLFDYIRFNMTTLTETGTTSVYARLTYQK